ncbi:hypothetical protein TNCV_2580661 [Trichonephila clavipes]|nr:hypothetical protein TNCV_2580661 [Trichonephila clavipes]
MLTHTLHKTVRHKFQRNQAFVSDIDRQFQADLVDMQSLAGGQNRFIQQTSKFQSVNHVHTPTPPHLSLKAKLNFNLVVNHLTEYNDIARVLITRFEKAVPLSTRLQLFSSCIQGSSESVQEFAARINKLGTQIFQSSNSAQNMQVRNANDQLLQSRFISGLRNDIRRFVLARDPINFEESINAALIEEQNVKLNQIANDERTGLSPSQTETSVISALTDKLQ